MFNFTKKIGMINQFILKMWVKVKINKLEYKIIKMIEKKDKEYK